MRAAGRSTPQSSEAVAEAIWRAFFPQAVGIRGHEEERIAELRARRTVEIERLAPDPISDPAREVLFTSNVLLTVPDAATDIDALPYPADLRAAIRRLPRRAAALLVRPPHPDRRRARRQRVAVRPARAGCGHRGGGPAGRVTCLLSVSVTHDGLGADRTALRRGRAGTRGQAAASRRRGHHRGRHAAARR